MASRPSLDEARVIAQYQKLGMPLPPDLKVSTPRPKRTLPSLQERYPEEAALKTLQDVADAQGWIYDFAWKADGPYAGLGCWCVRETEILYAQILRASKTITRDQQDWLDALDATGKVEIWIGSVQNLTPLFTRLQQPEVPHAPHT